MGLLVLLLLLLFVAAECTGMGVMVDVFGMYRVLLMCVLAVVLRELKFMSSLTFKPTSSSQTLLLSRKPVEQKRIRSGLRQVVTRGRGTYVDRLTSALQP